MKTEYDSELTCTLPKLPFVRLLSSQDLKQIALEIAIIAGVLLKLGLFITKQ